MFNDEDSRWHNTWGDGPDAIENLVLNRQRKVREYIIEQRIPLSVWVPLTRVDVRDPQEFDLNHDSNICKLLLKADNLRTFAYGHSLMYLGKSMTSFIFEQGRSPQVEKNLFIAAHIETKGGRMPEFATFRHGMCSPPIRAFYKDEDGNPIYIISYNYPRNRPALSSAMFQKLKSIGFNVLYVEYVSRNVPVVNVGDGKFIAFSEYPIIRTQ